MSGSRRRPPQSHNSSRQKQQQDEDEDADSPHLRVVGAWTKAGVASCVHVKGSQKSENFLLDCGSLHDSCVNAPTVLITHGHIDHCGSIVSHARGFCLSNHNRTPKYIVPPELIEHLQRIKESFEMLDGKELRMEFVPLSPGESYDLSPTIRVVAFQTAHRVTSQGYAFYRKETPRLKDEYRLLPGPKLAELRSSGYNLYDPVTEHLDLVYTGDTIADVFLDSSLYWLRSARIFIMEMTYIDGDVNKAVERGHVHLEDISRLEKDGMFMDHKMRQIVFVHFSQRYHAAPIIERLSKDLPKTVVGRTYLSLHCFGKPEVLTPLSALTNDRPNRFKVPGLGWTRNRPEIMEAYGI